MNELCEYNILLNSQYQLSATYLRFILCVFQYIIKHLHCYVLLAVTWLLKLPFNSLFPEHGQQRWLWQLLTKFFVDWMIQIREISNSLKLIHNINYSHEWVFILIPTKLIMLLFFIGMKWTLWHQNLTPGVLCKRPEFKWMSINLDVLDKVLNWIWHFQPHTMHVLVNFCVNYILS